MLWHFQPCCYSNDRHLTSRVNKQECMARRETLELRLKRNVRNVITEKECQFRRFLKENPDIDSDLSNSTFVKYTPIDVHTAFFGGYVDVFRTTYKVKKDERIRAVDFVSLYPYTNFYPPYFIGHPRIYRGSDECNSVPLDTTYGLIKCEILPPKDLFIPVLPYRVDGRLTLGLCKACMDTSEDWCTHDDSERSLIGTWPI